MIQAREPHNGGFEKIAEPSPDGTLDWSSARDQYSRTLRSIRDFTIERPAVSIGLALGMGALLGWLIKRR